MELDRSRVSRLPTRVREALAAIEGTKSALLNVEEHPSSDNHQLFKAAIARLNIAIKELAGSRLIESEI